eukprot:5046450-Alexandrium_andersonii.AAC.1
MALLAQRSERQQPGCVVEHPAPQSLVQNRNVNKEFEVALHGPVGGLNLHRRVEPASTISELTFPGSGITGHVFVVTRRDR